MFKNKNVHVKYRRSRQSHYRQPWLILLLVVTIILIGGGLWKLILHKQHAVSGTISAVTSTSKMTSTSSLPKSVATSKSSGSGSDKTVATTTTPVATSDNLSEAPSGTFVSNHRPNLSGKPAPSQEQSTCNTLPGASCYIKFTNNGIVKTLPVQTADSNGAVIWDWNVNDAGFSVGSWQITAIASLNGQTKSASDSQALEVQP